MWWAVTQRTSINYKAVKIGGWELARGWVLARDNKVHVYMSVYTVITYPPSWLGNSEQLTAVHTITQTLKLFCRTQMQSVTATLSKMKRRKTPLTVQYCRHKMGIANDKKVTVLLSVVGRQIFPTAQLL